MTPTSQPARKGWLDEARACPSPNFGPRPSGVDIDLALIHSISLPPGVYGGDEIERLFTNRLDWDTHPYFQQIRGLEVSSHFVLRRDGELMQFVSCEDRAWHAGRSVWQGRENCNDYSIGIELEGLEGETFEHAQYETLAMLLQRLARDYPLRWVAGHEHVAPGRKQDPGPGFDWVHLKALLGWPARYFPENGAPSI
ncbi:1,6-anhydro-N-acetylmuramyl-L-alanine amidase AmpD [Piscinibacter sp. HJYY11]|uniref:1,6-anhydro-N-acetylmuramyl-L-alanine amidase AmpD n=1 Tax=Piscinibacter sp. HJYY11 TaxID=2801333 RepID=UPI00191CA198|nr:1,6-anhydro-N-acetylmuramyl-L-alanine amidase AmpD [Piscinibacter sp. HJYY11]MBL0730148.1 1,6-anhydro-N-acetylmuramyl-L-alanine amidase AmpD [Piscinibacter sp. HJYY11]